MEEVPVLSRDEATVKTSIGPLALGLRHCEYDSQFNRYYDTGHTTWLGLDEDDPERSRPVLQESRQMAFVVWTKNRSRAPLLAYLGDPSDPWDDDLSIELKNRSVVGEGVRWAAGSEYENDDVGRIRTEYWCAARAQVTLYQRQSGDESPRPVKDRVGSVVSTHVSLDYDREAYRELYEGVLEDLSGETVRGDLASPLKRFVDYKDIRHRQEETPGLELFKRLQGIFPRYRDTLCQILRDPDTDLTLENEHVQLSLSETDQFFRSRGSNSSIQQVHQVAQAGSRPVPTEFTATSPTQTVETEANRFVAESVGRLKKCVDRLSGHLRTEQERLDLEKHESALRQLGKYKEVLTRYASALPYSPDQTTHRFADRSAVTYYDGRYSRLRQLTSLLDALMEFVEASEEAVPFEVQAFNKAYEHWCFIRVAEALREVGFEFLDEQKRTVTTFYRNPVPDQVNARMIHPDSPGKILELWYEREYPALRSPKDYFSEKRPYGLERRGLGYTDYRNEKRSPDIALEWHDASEGEVVLGRAPRIITLDPTLRPPRPALQERGEKAEEKYEYEQALRSFVDEGPDGKSEQIVDAAWGISPHLEAGTDTYVEQPASTDPRFGFIILRPETGSLRFLPDTLEKIIKEAGWL
jgi:hypothetical protein